MKTYLHLLACVILVGCSKNRYRNYENPHKKIVIPPDPPFKVETKKAPEVPEYLKATESKSKKIPKVNRSASRATRAGITYNDLLDKYTISGAGRYGMVYIDVSNVEILGGVEVSGYVDGKMVFLNGSYSDILNSISLSGNCGDFGFAALDVQFGGFLNQADLSGTIGDNYVSYTVSGVTENTNKLYVITKLIALLFDAE